MSIVALILVVPILIGLYSTNRAIAARLRQIPRTAARANEFAFFAVLIAAGVMVAAPVTNIQFLLLVAFVLYIAFLIQGGRFIWNTRWARAIRNFGNK